MLLKAMGLVGSTAYLVCMFCFIPVVSLFMAEGGAAEEWFLGEFLAATLSVCCMVSTVDFVALCLLDFASDATELTFYARC